MKFLIFLLATSAVAAQPFVELKAETYHVQGIDVNATELWVSSVDKQGKRGLLFRFDRNSGELLQSLEVQAGARYHPGGISLRSGDLWVPVAEYRRASSTSVQRRDSRTLSIRSEFTVEDHIGALAVVPEGIAGANWDAREFYVWSTAGKLLRKVPNPTGVAIQDMKFVDGVLIAGGLQSGGKGVMVWLEWPSLKELRRFDPGRTDRGVALTHEGIAVNGRWFYFLPEDSPSRLFAIPLPPG